MNSMAIDQWGNTMHDLGPDPKAGLLSKLGKGKRAKARPIHQDKKDGSTVVVGWVIDYSWWHVYWVEPMELEVD